MKAGHYASAEDVIRAGLNRLNRTEFDAGDLDRLLAEGEASIKQEGTLDGQEAFEARRRDRDKGRRGRVA